MGFFPTQFNILLCLLGPAIIILQQSAVAGSLDKTLETHAKYNQRLERVTQELASEYSQQLSSKKRPASVKEFELRSLVQQANQEVENQRKDSAASQRSRETLFLAGESARSKDTRKTEISSGSRAVSSERSSVYLESDGTPRTLIFPGESQGASSK